MFFFIYLRKQFKCSSNNNPFHYNQQPLQSHITVFSITNSSIFNYNKQTLQLQPEAFFIIRAIPFRSINALTALKRSQTTQYSQYYLFARRRKIKGQKQDLSSHSRPLCFINSPKRVLFRYAFLLFNHANAPLKHQESNKTPISFSSKYIDQSFYIDASPPCLCVVPFSNRYTSPQDPHRF